MFIVLIWRANQLISFYMMATLTINELNFLKMVFFKINRKKQIFLFFKVSSYEISLVHASYLINSTHRKTVPQGSNGTLAGPYKNRKTGMWDEWGLWVDCKYMEFVSADCCTRKWFDQEEVQSAYKKILLLVIWEFRLWWVNWE